MEHIVVSQIGKHLDRHRNLDPNQHGFRKGLCCENQLIQFVQELHTNTAQGKQVDAIVMDFSKAFDKMANNQHSPRQASRCHSDGLLEGVR